MQNFDAQRLKFQKMKPSDTADTLAYLKFIENVLRLYARNEIAWQDVRDTLKESPEIIAQFEAEARGKAA